MSHGSPIRLQACAKAPRGIDELIVLQLSNTEISSLDLERLRFLLDPPVQGRARFRIQNSVCLILPSGPIDPMADPCVRGFSRALFSAFPGCAFFLTLGDAALWKLALGLVDDFLVIESRSPWNVSLRLDGPALRPVVLKLVEQACTVARGAGADATEEEELRLGLWDYFRRAANAYSEGAVTL